MSSNCVARREVEVVDPVVVAKSEELMFLRAWFFCVVVHPTLNGPAASNSKHPPSVLSRSNAVTGKYSQTRLCGGVSALQS
jgi:hypothetical protein